MSKIGKIPVSIKEGVTVTIIDGLVTVNGPKGSLTYRIPRGIAAEAQDNMIVVSQKKKNDEVTKPLWGLTRALIANMVTGVSTGFEKKLELAGVGYRAQVTGNDLTLALGFSHPVIIAAPEGIKFTVAEGVITITGKDKALVGNTAATIRALKPPEPYKGKGIKYVGERIRRKAGKAAKAVGAK